MASLGSFEAAAKRADPDREPDTFTLCGETFTVADEVSPVPLMRFAKAADAGTDSDSMEGLVAMYDLLRDCLAPEEREPDVTDAETGKVVRGKLVRPGFDRFLEVATVNKVSNDTLWEIVNAVYAAVSGRPTQPPSNSSDGQRTSSTGSTGGSSTTGTAARPPAFRDDPQFDDMISAEALLAGQVG
jgi:hypothetical protein